jgi:hypothetical protein
VIASTRTYARAARAFWAILIAAVVVFVVMVGTGCGGVSEQTCEQIDWQGRQCEALDRERAEDTLRRGQREGAFR